MMFGNREFQKGKKAFHKVNNHQYSYEEYFQMRKKVSKQAEQTGIFLLFVFFNQCNSSLTSEDYHVLVVLSLQCESCLATV